MKKNVAAVAVIAVFAVLVFSINSIGRFIAEKVISPVTELSASRDENISTDKISGNAWEVYGIAVPVQNEGDAAATAESIKTNDGGGYVFSSDGDMYVIFSCLCDKGEAQSMASDTDGAILLTFRLDALSLKVTGSASKINAVRNAFAVLQETAKNTVSLTEDVQNKKITYLKCCTALKSYGDKLETCRDELESLNSNNTVVKALKDMYSCALTLWSEMPKSSDGAFLKKLRYASSALVCEYMNFCSDLGG